MPVWWQFLSKTNITNLASFDSLSQNLPLERAWTRKLEWNNTKRKRHFAHLSGKKRFVALALKCWKGWHFRTWVCLVQSQFCWLNLNVVWPNHQTSSVSLFLQSAVNYLFSSLFISFHLFYLVCGCLMRHILSPSLARCLGSDDEKFASSPDDGSRPSCPSCLSCLTATFQILSQVETYLTLFDHVCQWNRHRCCHCIFCSIDSIDSIFHFSRPLCHTLDSVDLRTVGFTGVVYWCR